METNRENEKRERLRELTAKIATEQDPDKFMQLVKELNQFLGAKDFLEEISLGSEATNGSRLPFPLEDD